MAETSAGTQEQQDPWMRLDADVRRGFRDTELIILRVGRDVDGLKSRADKADHRLGRVESALAKQTLRISNLDRSMQNGFALIHEKMERFDQRLTAFLEAQTRIIRSSVALRDRESRRSRRRS